METSSLTWMLLAAFTFGLRHGFDLDHIATIDAITRTARKNSLLSKTTGLLFSSGHGIVVTFISIIIGAGLMQTQIPQWLDGLGKWISVFFLLTFGIVNLLSCISKNSSSAPIGLKSLIARKFSRNGYGPFAIMGIGALFAFSFDTFSQIALFSLSASLLSGWVFSGILGLFFTLGMIVSDSVNGLVVSYVIQKADRVSLVLSKGLGIAIAMFSLLIAIFGLLDIFR